MRAVRYALTIACGLLLGGAGLLVAPPAEAGPNAAAAPSAEKQVVVVADVGDDVTANAKLRAAVFETAAKRGYSPAAKTDVTSAAQDAGAIEAGRVSTAPAPLGTLREKLDVGLLVRVSSDWVRGDQTGVRVTLVTAQDIKSQVVAAPSADPRPDVAKAVGAMLDEMMGPHAKPAPVATPAPAQGTQGAATSAPPAGATPGGPGVILPSSPAPGANEPPPLSTEEAWNQRGGVKPMYEARAIVTGAMLPQQEFTSENPVTKQKDTGHATTYGIGGGLGVRLAMLYLPLPDPDESSGSFAAFRLGAGIDGSVLYVRPAVGYAYNKSTGKNVGLKRQDRAWLYANIPLQLGVHFGIGRFRTDRIWRGIVLGFVYSPTWTYRMDIQSLDGQGQFNFAGFEADLDITSIEARRGLQAESQIRLSAYVLPRIKPDMPWLASVGIGAVWY